MCEQILVDSYVGNVIFVQIYLGKSENMSKLRVFGPLI